MKIYDKLQDDGLILDASHGFKLLFERSMSKQIKMILSGQRFNLFECVIKLSAFDMEPGERDFVRKRLKDYMIQ